MVRLNTYMDIEQLLRTGVQSRYGESEGPEKHIACISDLEPGDGPVRVIQGGWCPGSQIV